MRNPLLVLVTVLVAGFCLSGCRRSKKKPVQLEEQLSVLGPDATEPAEGRASSRTGGRRLSGRPRTAPLDMHAVEQTATRSLDGIERSIVELKAAPPDCMELATVLKRIEAQGNLLGRIKLGPEIPIEHRGERVAWELGQTMDELAPELQRCGQREGFLRIMEGR